MIVALSYVIATILTLALAIVLYPISGIFWVLGLLGKAADNLFAFTNGKIKSLWKDIRSIERPATPTQWKCSCGNLNTGAYCSKCGAEKPLA